MRENVNKRKESKAGTIQYLPLSQQVFQWRHGAKNKTVVKTISIDLPYDVHIVISSNKEE
ncbi:hypothetical protein WBG78_30610 [Chryseolinea sp. T2]|uniref:hypothetical protein n=1 Tax=Chryseolinea sp. T2 TaxID=3129255 RepID=UPI0030789A2F